MSQSLMKKVASMSDAEVKKEYDKLIKSSPKSGAGTKAFDSWLDRNEKKLKLLGERAKKIKRKRNPAHKRNGKLTKKESKALLFGAALGLFLRYK